VLNLTPEKARRMAEEWCAAWNRRDLDAVMSHYADDVALCSPTIVRRWGIENGWLHGRARVRENFAIGIAVPGLRFELVDVLTGVASMCVIYRRETGQLVSDTVELDDAGKAVRVVACYGIRP
jgi:hypothetical protein